MRAHRAGAGLAGRRRAGWGLGGGVPRAPCGQCSQARVPMVASIRPTMSWAVGVAPAHRGERQVRARRRGPVLPLHRGVALHGAAVTPLGGCGARRRRVSGYGVWGDYGKQLWGVRRPVEGARARGASACPFGGLCGGGRGPGQRAVRGGQGGLRGGGMSVGRIKGLGGARTWAWCACGARGPAGGRGHVPTGVSGVAVDGGPVRGGIGRCQPGRWRDVGSAYPSTRIRDGLGWVRARHSLRTPPWGAWRNPQRDVSGFLAPDSCFLQLR